MKYVKSSSWDLPIKAANLQGNLNFSIDLSSSLANMALFYQTGSSAGSEWAPLSNFPKTGYCRFMSIHPCILHEFPNITAIQQLWWTAQVLPMA